MLEEATLVRHLEALGWNAEPHGGRTLRSVRESPEGDVVVYIRLTDNWLIVSVVPFLATKGKNSFELSRWLLRQNRDMFQAKFAYDEDGDVVLAAELPTESVDRTEIDTVLNELVNQTVVHRRTLRVAAEAARNST
jgi:hypothetical protein